MDYTNPGQDIDITRWTAQEAYRSRSYATKCDVWSFGCLMWEIVTLGKTKVSFSLDDRKINYFLGATPYASLSTSEVPVRVTKGLRLGQAKGISDDLYQLMLECWQFDLDERPTFYSLGQSLSQMSQQHLKVTDNSHRS